MEMMYGYTKNERQTIKMQHNETFELDFMRCPTIKRLSSSFLKKRMTEILKDKPLVDDLRKDNDKDRHQFISADGMYVYSVGIIDYLQNYNNEKHMEHVFKEWRQTGHSM